MAGGNQLAIYKCYRGFELGMTENKFSKWPERALNLGPPDCESNVLPQIDVFKNYCAMPLKLNKHVHILNSKL